MSGTLLAWASLSGGVRVYDTADHVRIAKLDKTRWKLGTISEGNMISKCCLIWNRVATETGTYGHELMVGWGRHVMVARVVSGKTHGGGMDQHSPSPSPHKQQQPSPPSSVVSNTTTASTITTTTTTTSKVLRTIAEFDVPFDIAGIAPFGTDIAILAASSSSSSANNNISLRIYNTAGHQLFSDSLDDLLDSHLHDDDGVSLESYNPPVFSPLHNNDNNDDAVSSAGIRSFKWWKDGEEPMYFIYTPRHIILGRPRDGNDRIIWLCEKGRYKEAIQVAEEDPTVRPECAFQLGEEYLGYLMTGNCGGQGGGKKEYEAAAELVPWIVERLLKSKSIQGEDGTAAAVAYWERVVYIFALVRALGALADVLPPMQQLMTIEGGEEGGRRRRTTSTAVGPPLVPHTYPSLQHQHHQIRLNTETYNMVLNSFVLLQSDHPRLLKAVKTWPPHLYDRDELLYMCQQRRLGSSPRKEKQAAANKNTTTTTTTTTTTAPSSQPQVLVKSPALLETIAELLNNKGDYISALAVYVDVKHPDTFDYIEQRGLWTAAAQYAADLILIDRGRAADMLAQHADEASPSVVVSKLMGSRPPSLSMSSSLGINNNNNNNRTSSNGTTSSTTTPLPPSYEEDEDTYARYVTHTYLSALFLHSPSSIDQFAELQLHLHAEFDPSKLLSFLDACTACPLDAALQVCQSKGLVRESVFVLGRMGATDKALRLMVEQLRDVRGAVDFAASQQEHSMSSSNSTNDDTNDDDLWGLLITLALSDAELAGSLMDHSGGHIDPLTIIQRIPDHMAIERLRQRLVTLIHDHRSSSVLHEGAAAVLAADCAGLAQRLYRELRAALRRVVQQLANDEAVWIGYKAGSAHTAGGISTTSNPIGYNNKSPRRVMAASAAADRNASPPRPPSSTITMSSPSKFSPMKNKWTVQQHA